MSENTENITQPTEAVKRGRGRPKGSTSVSKALLPVNKAIVVNKDKTSPEARAERLASLLRVSHNKYSTLDEAEYQDKIEKMSLTELQDECLKVGLRPNTTTETRNITISTLMDLFHENKRSFKPDESGHNKSVISDDKRAKLTELMKSAR